MRRSSWLFVAFCLLALVFSAAAESGRGRIIKVLPHYLDLNGRHAVYASLYARDAYQAQLRQNPDQRSGMRFDVQCKGKMRWEGARLRIEIRGVKGQQYTTKTLEQPLSKPGLFSTWTALRFTGPEYKQFGEVVAWRATLWDGDRQVDEQKSFLW